MSSVETEPPPPPPTDKARRRVGSFIAAFVALQFLIPLTYLGREDRSDARFTWKTTEPVDTCQSTATLETADGQRSPLAIEQLIHQDWVLHMQRNRRAVVEAFLQQQCDDNNALEVELINRCDETQDVREYRLRCGGERAHETQRTAAR